MLEISGETAQRRSQQTVLSSPGHARLAYL